jgi:hypothetical protein
MHMWFSSFCSRREREMVLQWLVSSFSKGRVITAHLLSFE